jgi:hypothetical protein
VAEPKAAGKASLRRFYNHQVEGCAILRILFFFRSAILSDFLKKIPLSHFRGKSGGETAKGAISLLCRKASNIQLIDKMLAITKLLFGFCLFPSHFLNVKIAELIMWFFY